VKVFADGADLQGIAELSRQPYIHGMTTNPTLMRKVGVIDYESFAKAVLKEVKSKPISFEVFSDDFAEMRRQALKMHEWQDNVYVKIPITNTSGESSVPLIEALAAEGVKLNITAMLTPPQVSSRHCRAEPQRAIDPVSVRWTNRRYRGRPIADNEGIAQYRTRSAERRTPLGECPRSA
jgi:transaldolase